VWLREGHEVSIGGTSETDRLEPSTPSLPFWPGGDRGKLVATGLDLFEPFSVRGPFSGLRRSAPQLLHTCWLC
jgi:hypothetical protein